MKVQERVIVCPVVKEFNDNFKKMMKMFNSMTPEEHLQFGIKKGFLNLDGSPKLPEGDPCVTLCDTESE